uniref:Protein CASC3 n=1 Tax=Poecilia formosa TaxID=48698 RepID=A0A096MAN7_POEFO
MADRRRRRRRASQDSEDDDESGSGSDSGRSGSPATKARGREPDPAEAPVSRSEAKSDVESECESEDGAGEAVLSDYDSADPEENASHSEGGEEEEEGFSEEEGEAKPAAADGPTQDKGNLAGERQSGDGQESTDDPETKTGGKPGQQLDDDEDRKNPAYIPRKGLFFEHDVRGQTQEEERPKGRNRKLWKDEGRWEHDKFREEEQAPKSREELIAIYGYDIRNGGGSGPGDRAYRQRRPRQSSPPGRDKRWRDGQRPARTWQNRGGGPPPPSTVPPPSSSSDRRPPAADPLTTAKRTRCLSQSTGTMNPTHLRFQTANRAQRRTVRGQSLQQRLQQGSRAGTSHRDDSSRLAASTSDPALQSSAANREASPPVERPVERKSYSLARRTRSRPSDLGSKQASVEESAAGGNSSSPSQTATGGGGVAELDQEVARLNLVRQTWSQSPTSYVRSEMRGLPNPIHMAGGPPQYSNMEEMSVGSNRAKRYSSQRQRAVPEPAPPMHLGVMEPGHYYEPMSYQGPIYTHGEGPAPIPPQGMLVQPEMHIPHPEPGLHPHQSGAPIANPALYGGPPVSLSPGQPQQLLPPPFYPPPGVMTFPYPAMYPTPQGQAQVTYGGVTYYDTMQQQAQPKPSPPRRTSQPVTVAPPPP